MGHVPFSLDCYRNMACPTESIRFTIEALIITADSVFTMIITSLEYLPAKTIESHLGLVQGSSVRSKHAGRDLMAGLKSIFGGELIGYTELLHESREEAVERMIQQARGIGANAVLNVRFSTSSIASGAAEIFVYGAAVRIANEDGGEI